MSKTLKVDPKSSRLPGERDYVANSRTKAIGEAVASRGNKQQAADLVRARDVFDSEKK